MDQKELDKKLAVLQEMSPLEQDDYLKFLETHLPANDVEIIKKELARL